MPQQFSTRKVKMFNMTSKYKEPKQEFTKELYRLKIKKKKYSISLVIKVIQTKIRIDLGCGGGRSCKEVTFKNFLFVPFETIVRIGKDIDQ